ncbi:unnamed protein product [Plutella xylostella]|uniref:(diamondback moth) hypothetical protein n=1 Tax=Plutella xylostella TaxID=51655 RepID=A0A8S4D7B1_PLUXY|nr:unnamed protein product [Plutella xylostella]
MSVKQVRNTDLLPDMTNEGEFTKNIVMATDDKHSASTGERLFSHHTLASIRKMSFFKQFSVPQDSLDFMLEATYNHTTEFFPDKVDLYLQPETHGCITRRQLRNVNIDRPATAGANFMPMMKSSQSQTKQMGHRKGNQKPLHSGGAMKFRSMPDFPEYLGHPVKRGGIIERRSPFSVKLMNSGVHSSQTNPGYSRQPAGGGIFFY